MSKEQLHEIVSEMREELQGLSDYIYENPELGLNEYKSSQAHVDLLRKHGFDVEYPYLGFDTAFKATFDSGKEGPPVPVRSHFR